MLLLSILWVCALASVPSVLGASIEKSKEDSSSKESGEGSCGHSSGIPIIIDQPGHSYNLEPNSETIGIAEEQAIGELKWKYPDFDFESKETRQNYISSGQYNINDSVTIDIDVFEPTGQVFFTFWGGDATPASLCTVSKNVGKGGPLCSPFPDWSWATSDDCNSRFNNVFRVAIDRDSGYLLAVESGASRNGKDCPPKVVIFDLKDQNKVINIIEISSELTQSSTGRSMLVNILPLPRDSTSGEYSFVIADVSGYALIMCKGNQCKRIDSPSFAMDPSASVISSGGQSITLTDGVIGLAFNGLRLYYTPFASYDLCVTNVAQLEKSYETGSALSHKCYSHVFPSQVPTIVVSKTGAILFVLTKETAIGCLNSRNVTGGVTILLQDPVALQFGSGMKLRQTDKGEVLCIMTDRFTSFFNHALDYSETNFRGLCYDTASLLKGTNCIADQGGSGSGQQGDDDDDFSTSTGDSESHGSGEGDDGSGGASKEASKGSGEGPNSGETTPADSKGSGGGSGSGESDGGSKCVNTS